MALATVVAGPYTGTHNAASVGLTEDGFRLRQSVSKQLIRSDAYGDSVIDSVYRGGDVFLTFSGIEYSSAIAPWIIYGAGFGVMGQVGRLDQGSTIAFSSVLTAVAGTTAQSAPATLTATQSIIDENFNQELAFAARGRFVPLTMRCYPYSSSGIRWFSTT